MAAKEVTEEAAHQLAIRAKKALETSKAIKAGRKPTNGDLQELVALAYQTFEVHGREHLTILLSIFGFTITGFEETSATATGHNGVTILIDPTNKESYIAGLSEAYRHFRNANPGLFDDDDFR